MHILQSHNKLTLKIRSCCRKSLPSHGVHHRPSKASHTVSHWRQSKRREGRSQCMTSSPASCYDLCFAFQFLSSVLRFGHLMALKLASKCLAHDALLEVKAVNSLPFVVVPNFLFLFFDFSLLLAAGCILSSMLSRAIHKTLQGPATYSSQWNL